MNKKILISAIEVSADMHAAKLVQAIKKISPDLSFFGLGSEALSEAGVKIYKDLTHKSTVGLLEPFKHLFSFIKALNLLKKLMLQEKPAAFFCIDGQGFHLLAAKFAKKLGIPVIYYIAPQEWLWGTEAGGKKVAELCNLIIAIFPEEAAFYQKLGVKSIYHGHPLTEIVKPTLNRSDFISKYKLSSDKPLIALFPGSRKQEINILMPIFIEVKNILQNKFNFFIVAANNYYFEHLSALTKRDNIPVILKDNYNAMATADFILSSTGTITLEAALIGTPIMAVYKLSELSYWLLCKALGSRMPRFKALPNMLTHKEIMPEIIQDGVTADNIAQKIKHLFEQPAELKKLKNALDILKNSLQQKDILLKNANDFINFIGNQ